MASDTRKMVDETMGRIARDYNDGAKPLEKTTNVTRPQHMKPGEGLPPLPDTLGAARAEQKRQDDVLHGQPPQPRKP